LIGVSPASRGSVTLNSTDPFASPLIDPALLTEEFDKAILRDAVRLVQRFVSAPVWSDYITGPAGFLATALNSTNVTLGIEQYITDHTGSIWHPAGTASMSPADASWGVVNPDLKVKKVTGLRVVDASIFVSVGHFALMMTLTVIKFPAVHTQYASASSCVCGGGESG
jgi:choline dehydrogenase-like flavoprotein